MTNKIWKMCVVGLMLASPVICTATTITDALAAADDGKYVQMDPDSSITLRFGTDCSGVDPAVILKLAQASSGIRVEFYLGTTDPLFSEYYWASCVETGDTPCESEWTVYWDAVPFDSVKLTAYGADPVYLDAVQGAVEEGGASVAGACAAQEGTVKAFPAPAPVITGISIEPTALGSEAAVEAAFTDEDGGTHTATIDWGDDTDETIVECAVGCGTVSVVHTYADPGVYTVTVEVTDSDDGTGSDTAYAPVYDPDAWSWVTGAGWYPEEGVPCGKAFFGFVCRQSAGHAPLGEMRLRWGQNRFESTGYEWLVVSTDENTAWFGGTGTINGQGDYDFLVEVADAENEIWITIDDEDGNEYYDNDGPLSIDGGLIRIRCWD